MGSEDPTNQARQQMQLEAVPVRKPFVPVATVPTIEVSETAHAVDAEAGVKIDVRHLNFYYGAQQALFGERQVTALIGPSGCGKSTFLRTLNRMNDLIATTRTEGEAIINGQNIYTNEIDVVALRQRVGMVFQRPNPFPQSIFENIAYGLGQKADRAAIEEAAQDAQADKFIQEFKDGYETTIGERGVTLSGGQRQRIAIARALLTDPRILILDDSTSAIDSATEDEIQKAIRRVLQGRTTLLITHRLSQIRWADKILFLRKGELVDQGTHDELMAKGGQYSELYGIQAAAYR